MKGLKPMGVFDICKFDEYREDNRREVKKAQGGLPNSLWETYSSMANCYGGVIILGVAENPDGSFYYLAKNTLSIVYSQKRDLGGDELALSRVATAHAKG